MHIERSSSVKLCPANKILVMETFSERSLFKLLLTTEICSVPHLHFFSLAQLGKLKDEAFRNCQFYEKEFFIQMKQIHENIERVVKEKEQDLETLPKLTAFRSK